MALIKSANSDRLLKDAVVLDMSDLGRQAERLLASARAQAARLVEDAQDQATRLVDAADQRGYEQGHERGVAEGMEAGRLLGRQEAIDQLSGQLEQLTQRWIQAVEQWEVERSAMLNAAREDVIRLAIELGRRVVHRLASGDPTIIQDQLANALSLVTRPTAVRIAVHPDDLSFAQEIVPRVLARLSKSAHASLHEDSSICRGGCKVMTVGGHIDASIDTQLERLAAVLVPAHEQLASPDSLAQSTNPGTSQAASGEEPGLRTDES